MDQPAPSYDDVVVLAMTEYPRKPNPERSTPEPDPKQSVPATAPQPTVEPAVAAVHPASMDTASALPRQPYQQTQVIKLSMLFSADDV